MVAFLVLFLKQGWMGDDDFAKCSALDFIVEMALIIVIMKMVGVV